MSVPNSSTHGGSNFVLAGGAATGTGAAAATAAEWTTYVVYPLWAMTTIFGLLVIGQIVRRWRHRLQPER